jgi:acylphosphatase
MLARKITYHGRVQGVGFRQSIKHIMMGFDAAGYVRNMADGTVELWIQGEEAELAAVENEIQESHLAGFIQKVERTDTAPDISVKGFQIRL